VHVVVRRELDVARRPIVLDARVRLDDVSARAARVQVDDVRLRRNARRPLVDAEDVGTILERAPGLVRVERDADVRLSRKGRDVRAVVQRPRAARLVTVVRVVPIVHRVVALIEYRARGGVHASNGGVVVRRNVVARPHDAHHMVDARLHRRHLKVVRRHRNDIVKDVRGSESNCERDSRKM